MNALLEQFLAETREGLQSIGEKLLELERSEFMKLTREPRTQARIEHMLETGKPLRN